MPHIQSRIRIVPCILILGLAAVANSQVSNVTSDLVYNNLEEAYDSSFTLFGYQHQFVVAPNPPTTDLPSPLSDYIFANPGTGGTGELKASSEAASSFSSTSTTALLNATGFASAEINTQDTTSTYWSSASGGVDLSLDLSTQALVTFSVNSFNPTQAGCQFGANNIYVGDFLTAGNQSAKTLVGPGSYDLFMFYFTNLSITSSPEDSSAYAGGSFSISVQAVPEPAPLAVLGLGALGLCRLRRRK